MKLWWWPMNSWWCCPLIRTLLVTIDTPLKSSSSRKSYSGKEIECLQIRCFLVRWREFEVAKEELWNRFKVERVEWNRKLREENLEHSEWKRKFDFANEEVEKKYDAEMKELEKKCDADRNPFQVNQVIVSSIPKVLIEKVIPFQVAKDCTKFISRHQSFQSRNCLRLNWTESSNVQSSRHWCSKSFWWKLKLRSKWPRSQFPLFRYNKSFCFMLACHSKSLKFQSHRRQSNKSFHWKPTFRSK